MTDAHCHVSCGDPTVREFLIGRDFVGVHPWECIRSGEAESFPLQIETVLHSLRRRLVADPNLGVGEIGLDRLKDRNISPEMREMFEAQLKLAFEFHRPVVLHGAKCWGQIVKTLQAACPSSISHTPHIPHTPHTPHIPHTFLFHGFSRSDGLIPDIVKLNGYISVGPAVLNDHAVNYRELVKKIPLDRLLFETDRTEENAATCPSVRDVLAKTAELLGASVEELERVIDANGERFVTGNCDIITA